MSRVLFIPAGRGSKTFRSLGVKHAVFSSPDVTDWRPWMGTRREVKIYSGCGDLREENGEFHLACELNQLRYDAIVRLLRGQSAADVGAFEAAVKDFQRQGFNLTSLVANLRCPSAEGIPKIWIWDLRPRESPQKNYEHSI